MKTEDLIQCLGNDLAPLRPLAAPWKRAAVWLAWAGAYLGAVVLSAWMRQGSLGTRGAGPFVLQQLSLIATAVTASVAAFVSVIPAADRRVLRTPLVPGVVVVATLLWGCMADVRTRGTLGFGRETDWPCVVSITLGGVMLWAVGVAMLRRGAPLAPRASSMLAGVAALSVANIEACLSRPHEFGITVLLWHGMTTALMLAALVCVGRGLFAWKKMQTGLRR